MSITAALIDLAFYVVPFVMVLTLVVAVHELGHFLMARGLGVTVERFSLGFGRALIRWRDRAGVEWRIGWIPLGGYVKFAGDANAASTSPKATAPTATERFQAPRGAGAIEAPDPRHFHASPVWKRALVVAAGPGANFLLSIAIFAGLLMAFGSTVVTPRVGAVMPGSPAARAGFHAGDLIQTIDGRLVDDFSDLTQFVQVRAGQSIHFTLLRGRPGAVVALDATPERRSSSDALEGPHTVGVLGLYGPTDPADITHRGETPSVAIATGVRRTAEIVDTTIVYIGRILVGRESGDQLGGPLRIARVSGALAKAEAGARATLGVRIVGEIGAMLSLAAVLSVGIGFMNLLPLPILDGGHLVFYAYEAIAKRPVGVRAQAIGYRVGFGLLVGLVLFATWNDLQQLDLFKFLGGLVH